MKIWGNANMQPGFNVRSSNEIPYILLQFDEDHIIKENKDTTHHQNEREIEERGHLLQDKHVMVPRNECECRVPEKNLLGERWKNLKQVHNRSEPEPNLETDGYDLSEIPEKDYHHREKKSKGISEDLLDEVNHGNK